MKKQTKNTLKVLSSLALVSAIGLNTVKPADAKTYKPEVRYDNGKYFVKTSDPSAKGKDLNFLVSQNNQEDPYFLYKALPNYQFEEFELPSTIDNLNGEEKVSENNLVSIKDINDTTIPDRELENISDAEFANKKTAYYDEATKGAVSIKDALGGKQGAPAEGKVETPQPTKPVETPVKPKEEKKETPTTTPKTTTQTETPKTTQSPTTPEKKVTDKKETSTPKATQIQEKTTDNKQVTEKKETTAKPLPKTTAETFGGLALYTFGGLSLLSILVFFGLRKKQK